MPAAVTAPSISRFDDLDALSRAAADDFAVIAQAAIAARGVCRVALSGGSTPKRLFQILVERGRAALPWDQIDLWWGDERTVGPDHPDSNFRMTREHLIDPLGLDMARVYRIGGEEMDTAAEAATYERELIGALGDPPIFDLVWLGMGPDGHTASIFPGSKAVSETRHWVMANAVDSPLTKGRSVRITLTARTINAARHIRFLVAGADKAGPLCAVIAAATGGAREVDRYPAQLIAPTHGGQLRWLVDRAAAAQLPGGLA